MPVTSQGWRPISVTIQPASVATQPEKVNAAKAHNKSLGVEVLNTKTPIQERASISIPIPTMMRKAKNTGATGGGSSQNSKPLSSALPSWAGVKAAPLGTRNAQ